MIHEEGEHVQRRTCRSFSQQGICANSTGRIKSREWKRGLTWKKGYLHFGAVSLAKVHGMHIDMLRSGGRRHDVGSVKTRELQQRRARALRFRRASSPPVMPNAGAQEEGILCLELLNRFS